MVGTEQKAENNRIILWILGMVAIATTVYDFINLLPLFNAFFIRDDYLFLDLGAFMRQQDPLAFLTATCIGWWRPIALLLPALVYLLFGFNPMPYHVLAYIIHILTGFTLLVLCRRFFDLKVGLIAFTIYIASPISFSNVGWMLGAMEDETATLFYFLALYSQLRVNPGMKPVPYYLPALFLVLGSFCKITWLGLIPALLFMDWVNYPKSTLAQRLTRFTPFLIFIPTLLLNFLIIGFEHLGGSFLPSFMGYFTARNLILGSFLSFMPFDLFIHIKDWYQIMIIVPVLFFLLALIFTKMKSRIIVIGVSYLGTLAILGLAQIQKDPVGWIMGWRHLTPLVGFAAIFISATLSGLIKLPRIRFAGLITVILSLGTLIWLGLPMKSILKSDVEREEQHYRQTTRSFIVLCRSFPKETGLYIIGTKPLSVNLLADLAGKQDVFMLCVRREGFKLMHNYDVRSNHYLIRDGQEVTDLLDKLVARTDVRFISNSEDGFWIDISENGKDEFVRMLKLQH